MKMYLISDNVDTYTGMRLAGVDGIVVHEQDELKQALERVLEDKSIGIVLLTEKFGREFPAIIDTFRLERKMPLLVEIPEIFIPTNEEYSGQSSDRAENKSGK